MVSVISGNVIDKIVQESMSKTWNRGGMGILSGYDIKRLGKLVLAISGEAHDHILPKSQISDVKGAERHLICKQVNLLYYFNFLIITSLILNRFRQNEDV